MPSIDHSTVLTEAQRFGEITSLLARGYLRLQCSQLSPPVSESPEKGLELREERALMVPLVNDQPTMRRAKE